MNRGRRPAGLAARLALPKPAPLVMLGSLAYRARIALPADAVAVVELRDVPVPCPGGAGRVVAEQRIALAGRKVPVPFSLHVDRVDAGEPGLQPYVAEPFATAAP